MDPVSVTSYRGWIRECRDVSLELEPGSGDGSEEDEIIDVCGVPD